MGGWSCRSLRWVACQPGSTTRRRAGRSGCYGPVASGAIFQGCEWNPTIHDPRTHQALQHVGVLRASARQGANVVLHSSPAEQYWKEVGMALYPHFIEEVTIARFQLPNSPTHASPIQQSILYDFIVICLCFYIYILSFVFFESRKECKWAATTSEL